MKRSPCQALKRIDIFGQTVTFTFKDKPTFQTKLGATISLICLMLLLSFFVVRSKKVVSKDDPFFSMTSIAQETEVLDLISLGFMFAIENLGPEVG